MAQENQYDKMKTEIQELPIILHGDSGETITITDGVEDTAICGIPCKLHFFRTWTVSAEYTQEEKFYENGMTSFSKIDK